MAFDKCLLTFRAIGRVFACAAAGNNGVNANFGEIKKSDRPRHASKKYYQYFSAIQGVIKRTLNVHHIYSPLFHMAEMHSRACVSFAT